MSDTVSAETSDMMSATIECDMPYLRAIQKIPGDTAAEKFKWIGKLAKDYTNQKAGGDLDKVPQLLQPLLQIEAAIKLNTLDLEEDIKSALLSEDSLINRRALHAKWFFRRACNTGNVEYFCNEIFPYVSLNTRTSIIKTLAIYLISRCQNYTFAEELFTAIKSAYDFEAALPLIKACRESFVYDMIVENKLILSHSILKQLFRINSNLVARYLELLKPFDAEDPFAVNFECYTAILKKLVKKHLKSFINVCKAHKNTLRFKLSNTSTEIFLKEANKELILHPEVFFDMLKLKMISDKTIEIVFPKLLPESHLFNIRVELEKLKHYSSYKKLELLSKSYKDKYNAELLDDLRNAVPALLLLLPTEKRIEVVDMIKLKQEQNHISNSICFFTEINIETTWICYYKTEDVIPKLMEEIQKSSEATDRAEYIGKMIYCCRVNQNETELAKVIQYIITRHRNERSSICDRIMYYFAEMYSNPLRFALSQDVQSLVFKMINLFYIKHGIVNTQILESLAKFRISMGQPIKDLMEILVGVENQHISFDILENCPMYERQCLEEIGTILSEKYPPIWAKQDDTIKDKMTYQQKRSLIQFIKAIYYFNRRCKQQYPEIKLLTIKNYPDLLYGVSAIFTYDKLYRSLIDNILKKEEPELYSKLTSTSTPVTEDNIVDLTSEAGLERLKNNPENILNNWEKYLENCRKDHRNKLVQRFIKATRWYSIIPIKFAERCIEDLNGNDKHKKRSALIILSLLLHGDTLTKIIKPIMSKAIINASKPDANDLAKARENYEIMETIPYCMKFSNPPMSLDILLTLCKEDFLSTTLVALKNVSRRSSFNKVSEFAQQLLLMRVGVRKHGIRLLQLISSMQKYINHLDKFWATEKNTSIRNIILNAAEKLFRITPCVETWALYCKIISTATVADDMILYPKMSLNFRMQRFINTVIPDGMAQYIALWHSTINHFCNDGMKSMQLNKFISRFLSILCIEPYFKSVPDNIADEIITKYFFHDKRKIFIISKQFALKCIFTKDPKKRNARKEKLLDTIQNHIKDWNKTHSNSSQFRFYPVNHIILDFINDFTCRCVHSRNEESFDPKIVNDISALFNSHLLPVQDIKSYLMLEYTKLLLKCKAEYTENEFGLRLGLHVPYLVEIFTPLLVPFMAKTLDHFLTIAFTTETNDKKTVETIRSTVIEGLISTHIPSTVIAIILLSLDKTKENNYKDLVKKCMSIEHPAVVTLLNDYLNSNNDISIYESNAEIRFT